MIAQSSNKALDKRSGLAAIATPFERVPGCFEFKEQTQHSAPSHYNGYFAGFR